MADAGLANQWNLHKPKIRQLYLVEDMTLKELATAMAERYQFRATKAQYEFKLKHWKFRKNLSQKDWEMVHGEIRKRKREGKESDVVCSGVTLPQSQVEKAAKRYHLPSQTDEALHSKPQTHTSEDLSVWVRTPPPHATGRTWPEDLPWFGFQERYTEVVVKLGELNIKDGTIAASVAVREVLETPGSLSTIFLPRDPQQNRALACRFLSNIMPERFPGENVVRSGAVCQLGCGDNTTEVLEILFFLASNNMPGAVSWSRELDVLVVSLFRRAGLLKAALLPLASSNEPSAVALLHQVFSSAVRVSDVAAVQELLKVGINPNHPVQLKYLDPRPCRLPPTYPFSLGDSALPLQLGLCSSSYDLIIALIDSGADIQQMPSAYSLLDYATFASTSNPVYGPELLRLVLEQHWHPHDEEWLKALGYATLCEDPQTSRVLLDVYKDKILSSETLQGEALVAAVRNQYDEWVTVLLDHGVDPNIFTKTGRSPLWEAIYVGRGDLCELLLKYGACLQSVRPDQPTPLQCAAYMGNTAGFQFLLENGAEIDHLNTKSSCKAGHTWCLRETMSVGRTALEAALYGGQLATANMLLNYGAEVFGSELVIAIQQKLPPVVDRLISFGTPLSNVGDGNETALEAAIATGQFDIADLILASDNSYYDPGALCAAVHMAMATKDFSIIENLLERRSFSTLRDELLEGTALGIAAYCGEDVLVSTLLDYGITPTVALIRNDSNPLLSPERLGFAPDDFDSLLQRVKEESGWWHPGVSDWDFQVVDLTTPLELAVAGGYEHMVVNLLYLGCEPTPACVLRASFNGFTRCLSILLDAGVDVNERRPDLDTPLQVAVRRQHIDIVKLLLNSGADVNAAPSRTHGDLTQNFNFSYAYSTRTALQAAVELGDLELIDLLLANGAHVNAPAGDDRGATALQLAALQGFVGIAKDLLEKDADCLAPAAKHHGRTALQGAAEHGRIDMLQLLLDFGAGIHGSARLQYVQAVRLALTNGHSAAAKILKTHGAWNDQDDEMMADMDRRQGGESCESCDITGDEDHTWSDNVSEIGEGIEDDPRGKAGDVLSEDVSSITSETSAQMCETTWKLTDTQMSSHPADFSRSLDDINKSDTTKDENFRPQTIIDEDWLTLFVQFPEDS